MKQGSEKSSSKYALKKRAKRWVVFADGNAIENNFYGSYKLCYAFVANKFPDVESPSELIHRRMKKAK